MRCSFVANEEQLRMHSTSKKTIVSEENLVTIVGTSNWTSFEDVEVIMDAMTDAALKKNSATPKHVPFGDVGVVVSCFPVFPDVYTSRIASEPKVALILKDHQIPLLICTDLCSWHHRKQRL